jgi:hypothetical protein
MVVCLHLQRSALHGRGGILFEYHRTSRMPAAEYAFQGEQLPRAIGIGFVPSVIAGQPLQ